jgi:arsenate reductase (thioredoxin)
MTRHSPTANYDVSNESEHGPGPAAASAVRMGLSRGARHCHPATGESHHVPQAQRVLFLCTGNSARSQLAEAMLRVLGGPAFEVASAGTHPAGVHPLTIHVLAEVGIDITHARSKHLDEFVDDTWDDVITVCDAAAEACPVFPGATSRQHWSFPDPATVQGSVADQLAAFRLARDAVRARVAAFTVALEARPDAH